MKEILDLDLLARLIPQLVALAKKHWSSCDWQEGARRKSLPMMDSSASAMPVAAGGITTLSGTNGFRDFVSPLLALHGIRVKGDWKWI